MSTHVYRESTLGFKRTFILRDAVLEVERVIGARKTTAKIELSRVVPDSKRVKLLHMVALKRAYTYLSIVAAVAFGVHAITPVPPVWIVVVALLLSLPGFRVVIHFVRPMDVVQFKDADGTLLLDFICTKKQKGAQDEFLAFLREAIAKNQPNQAPLPTPVSVTPAADAPVAPATGAAEL
jgi:hypothetical protein